MSNPTQLPSGRVPLSAVGYEKEAEILPIHKAFIVYWMTLASKARFLSENEQTKQLILFHACSIAVHFSWTFHQVNVSEESIADYWNGVKHNVRTYGIPWNERSMAMVIWSQVPNPETYDEVSSFLDRYNTSGLCKSEQTVVEIVKDTVKKESKSLRDHYLYFSRPDSGYQPDLDPMLKRPCDMDQAPLTFDKMVQAKADRDLLEDDGED